jgi:hypothetical protein
VQSFNLFETFFLASVDFDDVLRIFEGENIVYILYESENKLFL